MSIISNQHTIELYTGKNKALSGQVLLSYTFKTIKDATSPLFGTKPDSKCVSVPAITNQAITESVESFIPKLQDIIHEERRLILRDAILAGKTTIDTESLDISAVLARWAAESTSGGRFSKATVSDWFDEVLAPVLLVGIMTKQNIPANTPEDSPLMLKVEKTLELVLDAIYTVVFSKKKPAQETLAAVSAILAKIPVSTEQDETLEHIKTKLDSWNNLTSENLLDNLGF